MSLPSLLIFLFAGLGLASLGAGVAAAQWTRRAVRQEARYRSASRRPELSDTIPRKARFRRAALVTNSAAAGLFLSCAAVACTTPFLTSDLDDIADHGEPSVATVVGVQANGSRRGRRSYAVSYRYLAGDASYTGVAPVESNAMLAAYRPGAVIPVVYSSVHPFVSRPGTRESAVAALRRSHRTSRGLSILFLAIACGFAVVARRRMLRALRLARTGHLRWGTILEVSRHSHGRLRAIVSIEDALGPRIHTWRTSQLGATVMPVRDMRIGVLADGHDPRMTEVYDVVQRWVLIDP